MRVEKVFLLIGLLLICVLLVVYFMAVEGEQNEVPLPDQKIEGPNQGVNK
jgi:hypothetical protein